MKTIQKINLNGLDKEKIMSASEMKNLKGGTAVYCCDWNIDLGRDTCFSANNCTDCGSAYCVPV